MHGKHSFQGTSVSDFCTQPKLLLRLICGESRPWTRPKQYRNYTNNCLLLDVCTINSNNNVSLHDFTWFAFKFVLVQVSGHLYHNLFQGAETTPEIDRHITRHRIDTQCPSTSFWPEQIVSEHKQEHRRKLVPQAAAAPFSTTVRMRWGWRSVMTSPTPVGVSLPVLGWRRRNSSMKLHDACSSTFVRALLPNQVWK